MAEFERNEHDIITSVTIYIICKHRPTPSFKQIIKEYTQKLVPDHSKRDNQVVIDIGEGTSTPLTTAVENLPLNSPPLDLKMGDSIMILVAKKVKGNLIADVGSSEPWFRTSNDDVFLYTNEHVVRPGMNDCKKRIVTHPKKRYIGAVILTSGEDGRSKDDATMECNNLEVDEDVRSGHSFIADWAIIKLEQAPTKPIKMPVAKNDTRPYSHINNIIHVPSKGMAMSVGAASRERSSEPWTALYTCQIQGDGLPTVFSPRIWRSNSKELACWSLSRPKRATYTDSDWYDKGIGNPGDSGAGVVDCTTGHLCGLVIGHFL